MDHLSNEIDHHFILNRKNKLVHQFTNLRIHEKTNYLSIN